MKHVTNYFETYPEKNEVFETSDGFLFHKGTDAQNHATTLKDKEVTPHKRKDFIKSEEKTPAATGDKKTAKPAKPAKKTDEGDKTPGADETGAGDDGKGDGDNDGASEGDNKGE